MLPTSDTENNVSGTVAATNPWQPGGVESLSNREDAVIPRQDGTGTTPETDQDVHISIGPDGTVTAPPAAAAALAGAGIRVASAAPAAPATTARPAPTCADPFYVDPEWLFPPVSTPPMTHAETFAAIMAQIAAEGEAGEDGYTRDCDAATDDSRPEELGGAPGLPAPPVVRGPEPGNGPFDLTPIVAWQRQVADWLRLLVEPGQVVELRALDVVTPSYRRPHVVSGFYDHTHLEDMASEALKLSDGAKGVYMTLNPLNPDLLARRYNRTDDAKDDTAADKDVTARRLLLIDIDPQRSPASRPTTARSRRRTRRRSRSRTSSPDSAGRSRLSPTAATAITCTLTSICRPTTATSSRASCTPWPAGSTTTTSRSIAASSTRPGS